MRPLLKSAKLNPVSYDIRGPLLREAMLLERRGHQVIKLNIGNPAPYGFQTPAEMSQAMIDTLDEAQGYCDARGLLSARRAVLSEYRRQGIEEISLDDIFMGNGVSELIMLSMQALLNDGDEVLIPAPDSYELPLFFENLEIHSLGHKQLK